jgi:hypothetical protein
MNGIADGSNGQIYYEGHEAPEMHDDYRLAKGRESRPFHVGKSRRDDTPDDNNGSILNRWFRKPTVELPVKDPEWIFFSCRWPGCQVPVRSDQVARLGGFCCDTQLQ